jgi:ABC-type antimicrobial peptide transport system permease subunit
MLLAGRSGIAPAAIGLVSGLGLSLAVLRAMHSVLFGVSSYDPFTLIASLGVLLVLAALASLLPALRIMRIQPAVVLRAE